MNIPKPDVIDFLDRVKRRSDGDSLIEQLLPEEDKRPRCPWCDDLLDGEQLCARRCHASRVNRTDER